MPLLDHFRPPLSVRRHWHAFHNAWATYIASHLNRLLPRGYFAESNVQFGIEIDVAAFEEGGATNLPTTPVWTAPAPTQTIPISTISDIVEVLVFGQEGGPTLAAAMELVSPANKDRPDNRDAFVSKCAAYLQQGVGLAIVDVVTDRKGNLHDQLLARLRPDDALAMEADLYAVAYHPVKHDGQASLDVWQQALAVDSSLPTLPLWLRGNLCIPVDLDATYKRTCQEQRVLAGAW